MTLHSVTSVSLLLLHADWLTQSWSRSRHHGNNAELTSVSECYPLDVFVCNILCFVIALCFLMVFHHIFHQSLIKAKAMTFPVIVCSFTLSDCVYESRNYLTTARKWIKYG